MCHPRSTSCPHPFGLVLRPEDIKDPNHPFPEDLAALVKRHTFLLIRGVEISDEQFFAMTERLGPPLQYAFGKVLNMEARRDATESQFSHARMALHQDAILNKNTNAAFLTIKCKVAPKRGGGETLFTNNRRFLEIAPAALIEQLRSVTIRYRSMAQGYYDGDGGASGLIEQKAIVPHPRTGEEVLYIGLDDPDDPRRNYQATVVGYSEAESRRFMDEIDRVLRDPEVMYTHAWQEGDVIIWDNFLACHGRNPFHKDDQRRLIRVAIT